MAARKNPDRSRSARPASKRGSRGAAPHVLVRLAVDGEGHGYLAAEDELGGRVAAPASWSAPEVAASARRIARGIHELPDRVHAALHPAAPCWAALGLRGLHARPGLVALVGAAVARQQEQRRGGAVPVFLSLAGGRGATRRTLTAEADHAPWELAVEALLERAIPAAAFHVVRHADSAHTGPRVSRRAGPLEVLAVGDVAAALIDPMRRAARSGRAAAGVRFRAVLADELPAALADHAADVVVVGSVNAGDAGIAAVGTALSRAARRAWPKLLVLALAEHPTGRLPSLPAGIARLRLVDRALHGVTPGARAAGSPRFASARYVEALLAALIDGASLHTAASAAARAAPQPAAPQLFAHPGDL